MSEYIIFKMNHEVCTLTDKEKATLRRIAAAADKRSKLSPDEKRCFVVDDRDSMIFQFMDYRAKHSKNAPAKSYLLSTMHCVDMDEKGILGGGITWSESQKYRSDV